MNIINVGENNIIYDQKLHDANITLKVKGNNNSIILGDIRRISNIDITIEGDNNEIVIGAMRRVGRLKAIVKNSSKLFIGDHSTIEDAYMLADFNTCIDIGKDCMISFRVDIRTTDAHGIYSLDTGKLLNSQKSISICDHVWIGQGVIISKGTTINKNSVIGACSYVQNKEIPKNCIAVGTPARVIKENIIWDRRITDNIYDENSDVDIYFRDWLDQNIL